MAMTIKWGRPTQPERDGKQLHVVTAPDGGDPSTEILVYVEGLTPGKTYEIEVEVKEKGADGDTDVKEELEVEDLVATPVPTLPPPDPK